MTTELLTPSIATATVASIDPAFDDALVPRPRLVRRLVSSADGALIVLCAPAGYGKSSLLSEWAACDRSPFLRVQLAPGDNAHGAVASLGAAAEKLGWLRGRPPLLVDLHETVHALVVAAALTTRDAVIVLDDAHAIDPSELSALVDALRDELRGGCRLAIATRSRAPLGLGAIRARRELVELRTGDLRMTCAEAEQLLLGTGAATEPTQIRTLVEQTEGWPAMLYLAALIATDETEPNRLGLDPEDHVIAEYLRDEVLDRLDADGRRFLRHASVLQQLSGPICDAVLGRRDSATMLRELAEGNALLVATDRRRDSFRWHGVFRSTLLGELRRTEPDHERELQRRACEWRRAHGELELAVGHAAATRDPVLVGALIWPQAARLLADGSTSIVQASLRSLTTEQIAGCAPLALSTACCRLADGRIEEARHWARFAEGSAVPSDDCASPAAGSTVSAVIEAAAAKDGPAQMVRDAARAYQLEPDHSPWRGICRWLGGTALHLAGDPDAAVAALREGADRGVVDGALLRASCLAQLAIIALDRNQAELAGELSRQAVAIVGAHGQLAAHPMTSLVFAVSAATLADAGVLDTAKHDLRRGVERLQSGPVSISWYDAEARILLARAAIGLSEIVRARTLLAEASSSARRVPGQTTLTGWLDDAWAQIDRTAETNLYGPSSLTIAELRVLRFLPSHHSFREIAERLGVSVNTVKTQVHAIYRKLDVGSRSQAVQRASSAGLLC